MKRQPGDVHPSEYNWKEQFDVEHFYMPYVSFDAGKVRGLAQYAEELEAERDSLRALCNWSAGRLLDAGDVQGHEHMLRKLEKP